MLNIDSSIFWDITLCIPLQVSRRFRDHFASIFRVDPGNWKSDLLNTYNIHQKVVFLVSWGGMRLSPFATSATIWHIVPAPDDRWWWMWSNRWKEKRQGKQKYSEKTYHSDTLSTTNPTWPDLGSNPGSRGGKRAANRLSYSTAHT
jgi:hypothetical protein